MREIIIKKCEIIPNLPDKKGFTIGWKEDIDKKQYGDFMYIPEELLELLKDKLCASQS